MIWSIISGLIGLVGGTVENWQKRQTVRAEAESRIIVAEAEARVRISERAQTAEIDWDIAGINQMAGSWKDEWFTLILSIPAIMAFIRPDIVMAGFLVLTEMPLWYQTSLGVAIAASFGYRKLVDLFAQIKGKK